MCKQETFTAYRCPQCGGDNVGWDAYSTIDPVTGEEVLGGTYDNGWCNDCGDVEPEEYEITDPGEIAHIRAERARLQIESAAPAMLAALQLALERLEINNCEGEENWPIATVRAAIAAATDTPTTEQAAPIAGETIVARETVPGKGERLTMADGSIWLHPFNGGAPVREA